MRLGGIGDWRESGNERWVFCVAFSREKWEFEFVECVGRSQRGYSVGSKEPMVDVGDEGRLRRNGLTALDIAEQNGQVEAAGVLKTASELEFERGGLFGEGGNSPKKQPSFSRRSKQSEQRSKNLSNLEIRKMERKLFDLRRD